MKTIRIAVITALAIGLAPTFQPARGQPSSASRVELPHCEPQGSLADAGTARTRDESKTLDAAVVEADDWLASQARPQVSCQDSTDNASDPRAFREAAPDRPLLIFSDQQPIKPGMFDEPTVWEDAP